MRLSGEGNLKLLGYCESVSPTCKLFCVPLLKKGRFNLPKRSWTATTESINFFSDTTEKPRRQTSTTKTTTTTNKTKGDSNSTISGSSSSSDVKPSQPEKKLHDFLSLLVSSPNSHSSGDTADLEELVSLMKAHTLFDPAHIPQPQHLELVQQLAAELPSLIPRASKFGFDCGSNSSNSEPRAIGSKSPSKTPSSSATSNSDTTSNSGGNSFVPEQNFKFSFSSDRHANFPSPPEKPLYTTDRPTYRRGGVYADEYDDMDTQDDFRDQAFMDPIELEAILQQRKILPLPKPRWKRKASIASTVPAAVSEATDEQQLGQRRKSMQQNQDDKGLKSAASTGRERIARRSAGEPGSSSRKLATEEASPSSGSPETLPTMEPRKSASMSKRGTKNVKPSSSKSSDTTAGISTGNGDGSKAAAPAKQQQQSNIPKTSLSSKPITASSPTSISSAPGQGGSKKNKVKVKKKEAAAGKTTTKTNEDNNKKKNTTTTTTTAAATTTTTTTTTTKGKLQADITTLTKKGKKAHQREQQQVQQQRKADWLDVDLSTSDLSMIKSDNPDEWICLFCQYEIFSSGLESAIRKRGGYRRRRLLRSKEINDSILQQERLSEDEDPLSLVEMPVDSRIRVVAGLSHGPTLPPFQ
ncbi:hypothetical protein BDB00DRAFT_1769 [Zychaea mexicana]|uniref:uncharacterized protein n=1 Tax=Zychaea mexicana TaxID=64656 RepID=UPI0022FE6C83|nr:uncharacterized protein BDB00DRAFT_1769 [Zychaea mexicana]KAI9499459.1 hypothetical protein BDB00DRAFT_1769 [Zychaea mexicana]